MSEKGTKLLKKALWGPGYPGDMTEGHHATHALVSNLGHGQKAPKFGIRYTYLYQTFLLSIYRQLEKTDL